MKSTTPHILCRRFLLSSRRGFSSTIPRPAFAIGPSPPRLPPKEQEEFEQLQRSSTGAFSTPRPVTPIDATSISQSSSRPQINQSPTSTPQTSRFLEPNIKAESGALSDNKIEVSEIDARVEASGKGDELHPDVRRGAKPEFEGDINPVTGEVGGPKNEPLRWGSGEGRGDWSYNGRVTDF